MTTGDKEPDPQLDRATKHADATASPSLVERVTDAVEDVVGDALDAARSAARRWEERPGARVRRVRRAGRAPLPELYHEHPEARKASPRELGVQTIDVDRIAGTAVGTSVRRGGDFLPRRQFRTPNWQARWQRIRQANDRLAVLPPIDVVRFDDRYWVLDGHNRVAAAKYGGQVQVDANVVDLVSPGDAPSAPAEPLAPVLTGSRALRTAASGRPVGNLSHEDRIDEAPDPP